MARDAELENWKSQYGRIYKIPRRINAEKVVPLNFWDFKGRSLIIYVRRYSSRMMIY